MKYLDIIVNNFISIIFRLALLFSSFLPIINKNMTNELYVFMLILRKIRIDYEKKSIEYWRKPCLSVICDFENERLTWNLIYRNKIPVYKCFNKNAEKNSKPIIYVHGGGLSGGHPYNFKGIINKLSFLTNKNIEAINYRLCPEYSKKYAIEDFRDYILSINSKWKNLCLIADSAGCYIIHNYIKKYNECAKNFNIVIYMSPMLGLSNLDYLCDKNDSTACVGTYKMCYKLAKINPPENIPDNLKFYGKNILIFAANNETIFPDSNKIYKYLIKNKFNVKSVFKENQIHAWPLFQGLNIKEMNDSLIQISLEIIKKY